MFTARAGGERMDAVTQAVEAVTNAAQNAEKEEKRNQPESVSNEWVPPLAAPAGGQALQVAGDRPDT
jgi:hypothetical protein